MNDYEDEETYSMRRRRMILGFTRDEYRRYVAQPVRVRPGLYTVELI